MDANPKGESQLSRGEILGALDNEIASIEKEQAFPGWTKWTFYGGFATLIWMTIAEVEKQGFSFPNAALVLIFCSVFVDLAEYFVAMVKPSSARTRTINRFKLSSHELSGSRLGTTGTVLRLSALLAAYYFLRNSPLQYNSGWFMWFYCVVLIFETFGFILSFFGVPVNIHSPLPTWGKCVRPFLIFVPLSIAFYQAAAKVFFTQSSFTASDFRLGLLATVFLWLLPVSLSHATRNQPLLESLKDVRRDLAFDRIDAGAALRQADIALDGMRVDDYFQADLQKVLQHFDTASKSMRELQERIQEANLLVQGWEASPPTASTENGPEPAKILRAIQESCELHRKQIGESLDAGASAAQAYYKKKPLVKFIVAKSEFERIETNIKSFIKRLKEQSAVVGGHEKAFNEHLNKIGEKSPHLLLPPSSEVK